MQHSFSSFKALPRNKELGYPMQVSLILEQKGSNSNLLAMDLKEIYENQWASNSLSIKFACLQHSCQQEQQLWCVLTGYRTILGPQIDLAMSRTNHIMSENCQLSLDKLYYEASSDNQSSRGYPKINTGKIIQSNIILTLRGFGQKI